MVLVLLELLEVFVNALGCFAHGVASRGPISRDHLSGLLVFHKGLDAPKCFVINILSLGLGLGLGLGLELGLGLPAGEAIGHDNIISLRYFRRMVTDDGVIDFKAVEAA